MPMMALMGASVSGLKKLTMNTSLSIPASERIQAVIVVPMLVPMMTLTVCPRSMMPELTSPTSMTVIAEED